MQTNTVDSPLSPEDTLFDGRDYRQSHNSADIRY
jgi:hypothetical protein